MNGKWDCICPEFSEWLWYISKLCVIIMIFHSRGLLYSIMFKVSLILMQLLTTLKNKVLDKNKFFQKNAVLSSLHSPWYHHKVSQYFIHNGIHEICTSIDIVLCYLPLLHRLTLHVYWDDMPHLTSLSNGSWFIIHSRAKLTSHSLQYPKGSGNVTES